MPFSTVCNKVVADNNTVVEGCHKQMEPYLDPKSGDVYCSLCDRKMANITHFVKVQMQTLKQYREKKTTSFAVKCVKCGKEDRPVLVNSDIVCPACKKPHSNLSEPFKIMLRDKLKTVNSDL